MTHEAVAGVRFAFGLALAMLAFRYVFMPAMVAAMRQDVFEMRRELFLMVARGKIEPTHPAYTRLRGTLNGLLRFAERVTFLDLVAAYISWKAAGSPQAEFAELEETIPEPSVREDFSRMSLGVGGLVVKHSILISPLAWALILLIVATVAALWLAKGGPLPALLRLIRARAKALTDDMVGPDGGSHCAA
jgi:hypothetical protein